jgi:hypothetical protein
MTEEESPGTGTGTATKDLDNHNSLKADEAGGSEYKQEHKEEEMKDWLDSLLPHKQAKSINIKSFQPIFNDDIYSI